MTIRAIEIFVHSRHKPKNTHITVATHDVPEARRIASIWGEEEAGEPVTRTIFKQKVSLPAKKPEIIDGVRVWSARRLFPAALGWIV